MGLTTRLPKSRGYRCPPITEKTKPPPRTGRRHVGDETLTVPKHGDVLVGPVMLRQIFNNSDTDTLWLIVGAPEKELEPQEVGNMSLFYTVEPTLLPPELKGAAWPPQT